MNVICLTLDAVQSQFASASSASVANSPADPTFGTRCSAKCWWAAFPSKMAHPVTYKASMIDVARSPNDRALVQLEPVWRPVMRRA
jgi:hypothetical protein